MKLMQWMDAWLIPDNAKADAWSVRKSRTLVFIHLFLLVFATIFLFFNENNFDDVVTPPLELAVPVAVLLILTFRKWGNFMLSGNLLTGFLFFFWFFSTFSSGGLYSDNLLWMATTPLLALLFADKTSGYVWLASLLAATTYLFWLALAPDSPYREMTAQYDAVFYFTSYLGLFVVLAGIVLIFATGQLQIVQALLEKKEELSRQKEALDERTRMLEKTKKELIATNKELEQFAYAASHDLKEPLRMIGSYTQLIQRRINLPANDPSNEYMGFVMDGVLRMEKLLNDLLDYSRLGRRPESFREVDLNDTLLMVLGNLAKTMEETQAVVRSGELPVIRASATEMMQLFQNLISNAIKFRRPDFSPLVEVRHEENEEEHRLYVHDNGIGIAPEYHESVFNIFERLHSRFEYEGTGIGLATCKKIVTQLGGRIWVEAQHAPGTAFVLCFPKQVRDAGATLVPAS
ncbi:MAG: hypothetical protein RLY31_3060 [Bacteroidota bacterium]|jgi:signal transduction histidine kinase